MREENAFVDWSELGDDQDGPVAAPEHLSLAPDPVEVRRNGGLAALIGALACAVAIAYLARATSTGAVVDWVLTIAMGLIGAGYLRSFLDARTPLLVADTLGVRVRLGRDWRGLPWGALRAVEHRPRRGLLRDGRLVLVPHNTERVLAELDRRGRLLSGLSRRLYGEPFAVPLGMVTRTTGTDGDLTAALQELAAERAVVLEVEPASRPDAQAEVEADAQAEVETDSQAEVEADVRADDQAQTEADAPTASGTVVALLRDPRPTLARLVSSGTGDPAREPVAGRRADVALRRVEPTEQDPAGDGAAAETGAAQIDVAADPDRVLIDDAEHGDWGGRVTPIARSGDPVPPLIIDDLAVEPAEDPVIGPELAAARTRLALSVDQLAERTRIRPHVIEAIEVDDFVPCGGDFYARGHLRTLARVLGVDVAPLLTRYDEKYADAPINPRQVFESELATGAGGSIRGTRGGPNWSVLIAAIMALILVWSVARLLMDTPVELQQPAPVLNGSAGVGNGGRGAPAPVPVVVTAVAGGATITVRDGAGEIVFTGDLAHGERRELDVVPPVRMESSDAGAVEIEVAGKKRGTLGEVGSPGRGTFIVR